MTTMRDEVARAIHSKLLGGGDYDQTYRSPSGEIHTGAYIYEPMADAAIAVMERHNAERTVPSDEVLRKSMERLVQRYLNSNTEPQYESMLYEEFIDDLVRECNAALSHTGVVPTIPAGWALESIGDCQEEFDGEVTRTYYACTIYKGDASREGTGDTWQAALAAACAQATGEGVSE